MQVSKCEQSMNNFSQNITKAVVSNSNRVKQCDNTSKHATKSPIEKKTENLPYFGMTESKIKS